MGQFKNSECFYFLVSNNFKNTNVSLWIWQIYPDRFFKYDIAWVRAWMFAHLQSEWHNALVFHHFSKCFWPNSSYSVSSIVFKRFYRVHGACRHKHCTSNDLIGKSQTKSSDHGGQSKSSFFEISRLKNKGGRAMNRLQLELYMDYGRVVSRQNQ